MANTLPASDGARFAANGNDPSRTTTRFWALTIGSVGVVYGDIGTSPLYAFRESLRATGDSLAPADVLGILSLIFWALMIVVTLKYVIFLIRADNRGEGGTLALMALAQRAFGHTAFLVALGITAAALFYGDAVITPALSVLSAVEGLEIVAPDLQHWILPLSAAILVGLFVVQSRGTATVSALFGPVTVVWFVVLAVLGIVHVADNPGVLAALNPLYAARFLGVHGFAGLFTLGAVFLAVTGAEALYADLGHFGRRPIQTAWLGLVLPALTLNYLGQGALVLGDPAALASPFFLMAPAWAQLPLVILATAATIIASQAVITGAYSLTRQAIQLGLLPRLEIRHTSETHAGQIYMPRVNWLLLAGVLLLVVLFRSSGALANAYGIAVTGTMVVTTILAFIVVRRVWGWSAVLAGLLVLPFLFVDLSFLFANMLKIVEGGWFPLLLGALVVTIMVTWRRGTRVLFDKTRRLEIPLAEMVARLERSPPHRMKGTAIFLTSDPESTPTALLHSLKHFGVLHDMNVILTIVTADTPRVSPENAVTLEQFSPSFARIFVRAGFMETPNIPGALATARRLGFTYDIMTTSFFLSRRTLKIAAASAMPRWQDRLFRMLARTADDASAYFRIPSDRVVEIGTQMTV